MFKDVCMFSCQNLIDKQISDSVADIFFNNMELIQSIKQFGGLFEGSVYLRTNMHFYNIYLDLGCLIVYN